MFRLPHSLDLGDLRSGYYTGSGAGRLEVFTGTRRVLRTELVQVVKVTIKKLNESFLFSCTTPWTLFDEENTTKLYGKNTVNWSGNV